jgi:hypothetical protein
LSETLLGYIGLESVQEVHGPLGMSRSLEDGPFVMLQDGEPVAQVGSMVLARFRRNTQVAAKERGPDLGNEFLSCIPFIGKLPAAEAPFES